MPVQAGVCRPGGWSLYPLPSRALLRGGQRDCLLPRQLLFACWEQPSHVVRVRPGVLRAEWRELRDVPCGVVVCGRGEQLLPGKRRLARALLHEHQLHVRRRLQGGKRRGMHPLRARQILHPRRLHLVPGQRRVSQGELRPPAVRVQRGGLRTQRRAVHPLHRRDVQGTKRDVGMRQVHGRHVLDKRGRALRLHVSHLPRQHHRGPRFAHGDQLYVHGRAHGR
mmetsp:Transcript_31280/g.74319  ORF Transcript_31280/g.74319 Transcript_31280/m.74319 type:complete len:223 (+) Transcript_31280:3322-3990(+)